MIDTILNALAFSDMVCYAQLCGAIGIFMTYIAWAISEPKRGKKWTR